MFRQSSKLANVLYDIRGPVLEEAEAMEAAGHTILKLNIGNPAPFGFEAPDTILQDMIAALPTAQNVYVAAVRYRSAEAVTRDVVLVTSVAAMGTMAVVALLLA